MALTSEPYVLALYGSRARGDHDNLSDIDMISIGAGQHELPSQENDDPRLCISHYSWTEFEAMHEYGSLFLRHLKMHAQPFKFDQAGFERYKALMETLPSYKRAARDIHSFRLSLDDTRDALNSGDTAIEFELSSIATTLRHSSILGCYLLGTPDFGRYTAVASFCGMTGLPNRIASEFAELYQFRMMIERNAKTPSREGLTKYAATWLARAEEFVEEVAACYKQSRA